jgi:hypothetical protein
MILVDPIELSLNVLALTSIEVPIEVAQAAVPEELSPVEIRPGISLAALIFFRMAEGCRHAHFGALPAYDEFVLAFHVVPSMRRLLPRMSFFVEGIATSVEAANRFIEEVHWLPIRRCAIAGEVDPTGFSVRLSDERGPILEMADRESNPSFAPKETLGQVFTRKEGRVAMYYELHAGIAHEHQTRKAQVELFEHPLLGALKGVSRTPRAYLQMWGKPGAVARQVAERPGWL